MGRKRRFSVKRYPDRRDALVTWNHGTNGQGYNVLWGIASDKLYSSRMVHGKDSLELRCLSVDESYYFSIETFNENGISERTKIISVK